MTGLNYKKIKKLSLSEAYKSFPNGEDLIDALKDGVITAEGKYKNDQDEALEDMGAIARSDDGTPDDPKPQIIDPHEWNNCLPDIESSTLGKSFSTKYGEGGFYYYYDIKIKEDDLSSLGGIGRPPKSKGTHTHELHDVIGIVIADLVKENNAAPSASDVWKSLKKRNSEFKIIKDFTDGNGNKAIQWTSSAKMISQSLTYRTFENLVSEFVTGKKTLPEN